LKKKRKIHIIEHWL